MEIAGSTNSSGNALNDRTADGVPDGAAKRRNKMANKIHELIGALTAVYIAAKNVLSERDDLNLVFEADESLDQLNNAVKKCEMVCRDLGVDG